MLKSPKNKNILVLAAHPDDETLGCGATIHRLSQHNNIHLLTFTDGVGSREQGQANRNGKLKEVCNILGIDKFHVGDFPDNAMDSVPLLDLCKFIESCVNYSPDIVFTQFAGDLNIDHQLVARATITAFRPQAGKAMQIYSYPVVSSTDYNPLSYFDADSYFSLSQEDVDKKIEALTIYDEEMRDEPHTRSYANVMNLMKVWGCEVGFPYCEKFKLIRQIL